ncbi:MAG TPA: class I SAM-dependent methyltransferase [Myxococcota bacterium]|nr:class I SAM-dependent methyltransferase [Myxococcota bacterium]
MPQLTPRADAGLYSREVRVISGAELETAPCLVCGGKRARPRFAIDGIAAQVVECEGCGLGRFHPVLGAQEIRAFYPDEYYGEPGAKFQPVIERLVRLIGARHIGFLSRGLARGSRVLDVGCGRGVVLGPLADRGLEVHGVEVSAAAARGADPRAEIRIAPHLRDAGYPDAWFDEVIIWHVLEHLDDPRATLLEAARVLRPGGRIIVAVPNFESWQARWSGAAWFHLDLPRHLYHFPLRALRMLLEDTGFEVGESHHFSLRQNPFGWIQSALNRVPGLPRNGLYTLLHQRARREPTPFGVGMRVWLLALFAATAPFALALSLAETLGKSGATVHVAAIRRGAPTRPASSRA